MTPLFFFRSIKWITKISCMIFVLAACSKNGTGTTPQIKIINFSPTSGTSGNTVTITGIGFGSTNTATVYLNGSRKTRFTVRLSYYSESTDRRSHGKISLTMWVVRNHRNDFIILRVWIRIADLPILTGRGLGAGFQSRAKGISDLDLTEAGLIMISINMIPLRMRGPRWHLHRARLSNHRSAW
jgi:hypothetical protein